jgi:hypothetical protein
MIVAELAMESGAALSAFFILSSLVVGAAEGFDGTIAVDDVDDAAVAVVSAEGVADVPQAVIQTIGRTSEAASWMRIEPPITDWQILGRVGNSCQRARTLPRQRHDL